eukprot:gene3355-88_t
MGMVENAHPGAGHGFSLGLKAGMEGLDKQTIEAKIYEASKHTKYFQAEKQREQKAHAKVAELQQKLVRLRPEEILTATAAADAQIKEYLTGQDWNNRYVHVDMDAFYAAVEMRDDPSLAKVPMAVGSMSMVSTSNYLARKWGVRSAMAGFIAKKLCPDLVFVKPNFEKYRETSAVPRSLDEASLNVTPYLARASAAGAPTSAWDVAAVIRRTIEEKTQVTGSAGIAVNRVLAKMASNMNKPNGQHELEASAQATEAFLRTLPIRKIPGLGIRTVGDIYTMRGQVLKLFRPLTVSFLLRASTGCWDDMEEEEGDKEPDQLSRKSVSSERTFGSVGSVEELLTICRSLAQRVSGELAAKGLGARNLTVKLKHTDFMVRSHAVTLKTYVQAPDDILTPCVQILRAEGFPLSLRLLGVRAAHLAPYSSGAIQPSLLPFLPHATKAQFADGTPASCAGPVAADLSPLHAYCPEFGGSHTTSEPQTSHSLLTCPPRSLDEQLTSNNLTPRIVPCAHQSTPTPSDPQECTGPVLPTTAESLRPLAPLPPLPCTQAAPPPDSSVPVPDPVPDQHKAPPAGTMWQGLVRNLPDPALPPVCAATESSASPSKSCGTFSGPARPVPLGQEVSARCPICNEALSLTLTKWDAHTSECCPRSSDDMRPSHAVLKVQHNLTVQPSKQLDRAQTSPGPTHCQSTSSSSQISIIPDSTNAFAGTSKPQAPGLAMAERPPQTTLTQMEPGKQAIHQSDTVTVTKLID